MSSRTEHEVSNGTRGLERNTRSRTEHEFSNLLYTFHIQKCLEKGKQQNPSKSHYFKVFLSRPRVPFETSCSVRDLVFPLTPCVPFETSFSFRDLVFCLRPCVPFETSCPVWDLIFPSRPCVTFETLFSVRTEHKVSNGIRGSRPYVPFETSCSLRNLPFKTLCIETPTHLEIMTFQGIL